MGGLSVANRGRDLSDRHRRAQEQLRCAPHPHGPQLGSHRRTRVGENPLELTPRCQHAPSERLDREVLAIFALDDRVGIAEKGRAQASGAGRLCGAARYARRRREVRGGDHGPSPNIQRNPISDLASSTRMPGFYAVNVVDWRKADSGSPSTWFVSIPQVGMRATTVRFGDDLWAMLERESQGLGISAAQFVREATILRLAMLAGARGDSQAEATIAEVAARATLGGGDSRLAKALVDPERLVALHHAGIVDTPREESFDRIASLAARVLNAPVALVSATHRARQFFKSCLGLPEPWASRRESPLTHSFCQHVVAAREPLVVSDARQDPQLRDNLAIRDMGVIAYLGVPLITREGHAVGTLCVIDHKPRVWTTDQVDLLRDLATSVVTEITLRSAPDGALRRPAKRRRNSRV